MRVHCRTLYHQLSVLLSERAQSQWWVEAAPFVPVEFCHIDRIPTHSPGIGVPTACVITGLYNSRGSERLNVYS